jgi:uncharacterized protein YgiM (DUF1202 family)
VLALCAVPIADARPAGSHRAIAQAQAATTARTNQPVVLRKKPSAKAAAVGKLPKDTAVAIDKPAEKGWVRVRATPPGKRAKEISGFVLASQLTTPDEPATAPQPAGDDDIPTTDTPVTPEQRVTAEWVVIHEKPGEKQASTGTLQAGTTVTVEAERGRWLRIRSGKIVGYIARTQLAPAAPPPAVVDAPPPEEARPSTWSSARGTSSELFAEVTAPATLRERPDALAPQVGALAKGDRVAVLDATTTAGWVNARDAKGTEGWIAAAELGNGAAANALDAAPAPSPVASPSSTTTTTVSTGSSPVAAAPASPLVRLDVGLGYRVLGMDFSSNGSTGISNYVVSADASALAIELDAAPLRLGAFGVGIDARTTLSRSSPGIEYMGPTLPSGKIPFSTVDADAGLRAGMRVRRIYVLALRAGMHYDAFVAKDVENAATLPRERLLGGTAGARADISPPGSRFAATVHADVLVAGTRKQTPGLEDGTASSAKAVWGGMVVRVQLAAHISLIAAYDFGHLTTTWSGDSVRMPGVTHAKRIDSTQLVQLGLSIEM